MKKKVRTSITVPKELLALIDKAAKVHARNRSGYITWVMIQQLQREKSKLDGRIADMI